MPNRRSNSRSGSRSGGAKLFTQLGRIVALAVITGLVWLFNEYVVSIFDEPSAKQAETTAQSSAPAPAASAIQTPTQIPPKASPQAPPAEAQPSEPSFSAAPSQPDEPNEPAAAAAEQPVTPLQPPTDFIGGWPQVAQAGVNVQILTNTGYVAGYSASRRTPLWVAYELIDQYQKDKLQRYRFEADGRVSNPVEYYDYSGSGYTRGHMAPSFSIGKSHGAKAQEETFLMTNITPQLESFNRKWWQRLEEVVISDFTRRLNNVWVITGPVFDTDRTYLQAGVDIPDAFYKILLAKKRDGSFISLAFLVPQTAGPTDPLSDYMTSIDVIEQQTGLDFWVTLPDSVENRLEAQRRADRLWKLSDVDRKPPRY